MRRRVPVPAPLATAIAWAAVLPLSACGGDDEGEFGRDLVDCTAEATACDRFGVSGCAVQLRVVSETGEVVGICGGGEDRRVCTVTCEGDGTCPDGWTCQLPDQCPGETSVRYCVPSEVELQRQGVEPGCRGTASPKVCGFF